MISLLMQSYGSNQFLDLRLSCANGDRKLGQEPKNRFNGLLEKGQTGKDGSHRTPHISGFTDEVSQYSFSAVNSYVFSSKCLGRNASRKYNGRSASRPQKKRA